MELKLTGQYLGGTLIGLGWGVPLGFLMAKYTDWGGASRWAVVLPALALILAGQYVVWKAQKAPPNADPGAPKRDA